MVVRHLVNAWQDSPARVLRRAGFVIGLVLLTGSLWMLWRSGHALRLSASSLAGQSSGGGVSLDAIIAHGFDFLVWYAGSLFISTILTALYIAGLVRTGWWLFTSTFVASPVSPAVDSQAHEQGEAMNRAEQLAFNRLAEAVELLNQQTERLAAQIGNQTDALEQQGKRLSQLTAGLKNLNGRVVALEPEPVIPLTPEQILAQEKAQLQREVEELKAMVKAQLAANPKPTPVAAMAATLPGPPAS